MSRWFEIVGRIPPWARADPDIDRYRLLLRTDQPRLLRCCSGYNMERAAKELRCSPATLGRWEKGQIPRYQEQFREYMLWLDNLVSRHGTIEVVGQRKRRYRIRLWRIGPRSSSHTGWTRTRIASMGQHNSLGPSQMPSAGTGRPLKSAGC